MEIYLDDARVDAPPDTQGTLETGLRALQSSLRGGSRIIVAVKCDGVLLLDKELQDALQRPMSAFRCIELTTASPSQLARHALTEARAALAEVDRRRDELAELFSAGRSTDAMQGLGEMLGVWQQVHEVVVKSLQMLDLDPAAITVEGTPLEEAMELPRQHLIQIRDALQSQDFVQLADILEYEFGQAVNSWNGVIEAIQQRAAGAAEAPPQDDSL